MTMRRSTVVLLLLAAVFAAVAALGATLARGPGAGAAIGIGVGGTIVFGLGAAIRHRSRVVRARDAEFASAHSGTVFVHVLGTSSLGRELLAWDDSVSLDTRAMLGFNGNGVAEWNDDGSGSPTLLARPHEVVGIEKARIPSGRTTIPGMVLRLAPRSNDAGALRFWAMKNAAGDIPQDEYELDRTIDALTRALAALPAEENRG